jgi:hypothetical protein
MCCDYELPLDEEEQEKKIEKENKSMQRTEFKKAEEEPIPA